MYKIDSVDALYDHIGYVVIYAPDKFPYRDYLPDDEQMNLDLAFEQLRQGVEIAYPDDYFPERREGLYAMLDQSLAAYRAGDDVGGAHLLHNFQNAIFADPK
jgi:hypothetical protein